jgi:hypothetical protein
MALQQSPPILVSLIRQLKRRGIPTKGASITVMVRDLVLFVGSSRTNLILAPTWCQTVAKRYQLYQAKIHVIGAHHQSTLVSITMRLFVHLEKVVS